MRTYERENWIVLKYGNGTYPRHYGVRPQNSYKIEGRQPIECAWPHGLEEVAREDLAVNDPHGAIGKRSFISSRRLNKNTHKREKI
jgi:hypothetical protein